MLRSGSGSRRPRCRTRPCRTAVKVVEAPVELPPLPLICIPLVSVFCTDSPLMFSSGAADELEPTTNG